MQKGTPWGLLIFSDCWGLRFPIKSRPKKSKKNKNRTHVDPMAGQSKLGDMVPVFFFLKA